jgi:predicted AAA+ superfamily ATPase
MSVLVRALSKQVAADLEQKMVFLGGPRQVGKTTLAQSLIKNYKTNHPAYLNWDNAEHRKRILQASWPRDEQIIIFDEIHKFKNWRNLVKGYFDTLKDQHKFLVTGSARLDYYRRGGDSLLGRYHYHRLHPLTLPEIGFSKNLSELLRFGGFPEPFLKSSERELKRWHLQRKERVVYSDIRDLEKINEITLIELLINALPDRVGSPLSRKSLAEDILVNEKTVERWLSILERVYYCYRISPYGAPQIRAVKKEQKLYLWDWSELESAGAQWENFVASHLLKFCHYHEDVNGEKMELRYLRDTDKREVDFVVLKNKKPLFAVECKTGERSISPYLHYFSERTPIPIFYQVHKGSAHRQVNKKILLIPFDRFANEVQLI